MEKKYSVSHFVVRKCAEEIIYGLVISKQHWFHNSRDPQKFDCFFIISGVHVNLVTSTQSFFFVVFLQNSEERTINISLYIQMNGKREDNCTSFHTRVWDLDTFRKGQVGENVKMQSKQDHHPNGEVNSGKIMISRSTREWKLFGERLQSLQSNLLCQ